MFHTFESTKTQSPEQAESNASSAAKRRTSTVRACEPCRRRKIRCNGEHPCETCQWYRKAASCHYTEPRQRQMPTKRSVEKISQTLEDYRGILQKLFPNVHPDQLAELPREKLIELISKTSPLPPSPITPGVEEKPPPLDPDAGSLEQLQPMPEEGTESSETKPKSLRGITDDVNALSLSVKQSTSYLGISSVMAALRVIIWLDPESQAFFTKTPDRSALASREASSPPEEIYPAAVRKKPDYKSSSAWDEIPLINAYFTYVHPFIPILDEEAFRNTYIAKKRTDSRWCLLLNTVLAMGSMAAGSSEDTSHTIYYARAKEHLDIDTLNSAHIETVQALAILGGFYVHYLQLPSQGNAMMGAALRIATMLGLHRDYTEGVGPGQLAKAASSIEMRRRVWWCTFILDAWHGTALGRPSMGRMSHAITTKAPQEAIGGSIPMLTLVQENIRFCIISTKMEDSLAVSPLIDETERRSLDTLFVDWFKASTVQNTTPRPLASEMSGVSVTKNVMRWRYLQARVLLHRPVLLWYAMRKMPFETLSKDKQFAIEVCRDITADLIGDIACTWQAQKACLMAGWNATWILYQAVMVPLLSLFSDPSDTNVVDRCRGQVEMAMNALENLRGWSTTAKRSLEVVSRIYEASRRHSPETNEQSDYYATSMEATGNFNANMRPSYIDTSFGNARGFPTQMDSTHQEMFMDNMFDSLNWTTGLDNLDFPFQTPSLGWEYNGGSNFGGSTHFDGYFNPMFTDQTHQVDDSMTSQEGSEAPNNLHNHYRYQ